MGDWIVWSLDMPLFPSDLALLLLISNTSYSFICYDSLEDTHLILMHEININYIIIYYIYFFLTANLSTELHWQLLCSC